MCAACVAQGVGYVGASLVGLRVMAAHARVRRASNDNESHVIDDLPPDEQTPADPDRATATPTAL
jgi:hypothetical protein